MSLLKWTERIVSTVREPNLVMALFGKMILVFFVGAQFASDIVAYGYALHAAAVAFLIIYLALTFVAWSKRETVSFYLTLLGMIGTYLVVLLLGIQSAQLPYKWALVLLAIGLIIPACLDMMNEEHRKAQWWSRER